MARTNEFGQPIGDDATGWNPVEVPTATTIDGQFCTLERLDPDRHGTELFSAYAAAPDARDWTYLSVGPFTTYEHYLEWLTAASTHVDPRHYAVIDKRCGTAVGTLALMRHDPVNGAIEVGWVTFSRAMQRTPLSTEAHFLLMRYVFDELGYRRYEWKCDSLNAASCNAAERLGFRFEGVFRQAVVCKGRNRDTAWFSLIDREWPVVRDAFEAWLAPSNFDTDGSQRTPLQTR